MNITLITNGKKVFERGVKYIDAEAKVITNIASCGKDVNKAKEFSLAMIGQGVDVISPMADQTSLGVMAAAEQSGIMAIASGEGMESVAPNIIVQQAYKEFIERKDRNQYRLSRRPFIFSCRQNDTLFGGVIQNSERIHLEDSSLSCCAK